MNISISKQPILIRAGQRDLSGVYAKPFGAPRALIVAFASALDELSQIFPQAPFVGVRRQRFVAHQLSANLAARAFYLHELAFVEECRVYNSMNAPV